MYRPASFSHWGQKISESIQSTTRATNNLIGQRDIGGAPTIKSRWWRRIRIVGGGGGVGAGTAQRSTTNHNEWLDRPNVVFVLLHCLLIVVRRYLVNAMQVSHCLVIVISQTEFFPRLMLSAVVIAWVLSTSLQVLPTNTVTLCHIWIVLNKVMCDLGHYDV